MNINENSTNENVENTHNFLAFLDYVSKNSIEYSQAYTSIFSDIKINKNSLSGEIPTIKDLKSNFNSFLHFK